jgi:hypothetical protein
MSYRAGAEEKRQIVEYLTTSAGRMVFKKIEGKSDDFRVKLRIPEPTGTFEVKLPAGELRNIAQSLLNFIPKRRESKQVNPPPPGCKFIEHLMRELPNFCERTAGYRLIDIQLDADKFHLLHPTDEIYDPVATFPDIKPIVPGFVMEFRTPYEMVTLGIERVAVVFIPEPVDPAVGAFLSLNARPKWAMTAAIIYEQDQKIEEFHVHLHYWVGADGTLASMGGGAYCVPDKRHRYVLDEEFQLWVSFRDWFLAPCWFALCSIRAYPVDTHTHKV